MQTCSRACQEIPSGDWASLILYTGSFLPWIGFHSSHDIYHIFQTSPSIITKGVETKHGSFPSRSKMGRLETLLNVIPSSSLTASPMALFRGISPPIVQ